MPARVSPSELVAVARNFVAGEYPHCTLSDVQLVLTFFNGKERTLTLPVSPEPPAAAPRPAEAEAAVVTGALAARILAALAGGPLKGSTVARKLGRKSYSGSLRAKLKAMAENGQILCENDRYSLPED